MTKNNEKKMKKHVALRVAICVLVPFGFVAEPMYRLGVDDTEHNIFGISSREAAKQNKKAQKAAKKAADQQEPESSDNEDNEEGSAEAGEE